MNRWPTAAAACLAATLPVLSGCHARGWSMGFGSNNRVHEDFRYHATLHPGGRLEVENTNGSVEVMAWAKDDVEITGTKFSDTREHLHAVKIDVNASPDLLRIRTIGPDMMQGGYGAKYVIHVPARTVVDTIESSNGSIQLEGLQGRARLRTSNGAVRVHSLDGDLDAHTSNGRVEVSGLNGAALIQTSNGAVQMEEVRGALDVRTSNGSVTARMSSPDAHKPIRIETSNGSVNLVFDQLRENPVRVRTSNSSITMRLPATVNAQVSASTSHGSILSELDLPSDATSDKERHHLEARLGTGGPMLSLSTSNGSIKLLKN